MISPGNGEKLGNVSLYTKINHLNLDVDVSTHTSTHTKTNKKKRLYFISIF